MKITYEPLRDYLGSIGRTINYLRTEGIINSNAAKQLAVDEPVSLRKIIEICEFLDVDIEDVIKLILE